MLLLLLEQFGILESFTLFFSNSPSVIVPDSLLLAMDLALELQRHSSMMMIQWWISENCGEFHRIVLESWFWEIRVLSCSWASLSLLWFLILTAKREKNGICLWWCGLHCVDLWRAWPYIGWQVAAGPIAMWHVDWVGLRGTLDQSANLKRIGPFCK